MIEHFRRVHLSEATRAGAERATCTYISQQAGSRLSARAADSSPVAERFLLIFHDLFEGRYERAEEVIAGRAGMREARSRLRDPVRRAVGRDDGPPMATKLYEACSHFDRDGTERRERTCPRISAIGARDSSDVPATSVRRKRLELLVEHCEVT